MRWLRSKGKRETTMPKRRDVLRGAGLAMLVALGLIVWVLVDDDGGDEGVPAPASAGAIVDVDGLREAASAGPAPIYWAGPPAGAELELSQPAPDRTYVRYLTGDAKVDDPRPFLTVGSYRLPDPVGALRKQGSQPGGVLAKAPGGGVVYFSRERPESVYLAYPNEEVEIEVFAPSFEQALQLVTAGKIVPVE
ncbi:MAG TPA: hypothetical protein VF729_07100 [Solirubrobacterales bacterium]